MPTPTTVTVPTAAALLGMSKAGVYRAIRNGNFPTPAQQIGGRYIIPAKPLLDFLGLEEMPEGIQQ